MAPYAIVITNISCGPRRLATLTNAAKRAVEEHIVTRVQILPPTKVMIRTGVTTTIPPQRAEANFKVPRLVFARPSLSSLLTFIKWSASDGVSGTTPEF